MLKDNPIWQQLKSESARDKKSDSSSQSTDRKNSNTNNQINKNNVNKKSRNDFNNSKTNFSKNFHTNNTNNVTGSEELKEGVVKATDKGYGFLEVEPRVSYFIPPKQMLNLLNGDRIKARIIQNGDKFQAAPVELVEPGLDRFVARVKFVSGYLAVLPDRPNMKKPIRARNTVSNVTLKEGDWVIAKLTKHAMLNRGVHSIEIIEYVTSANDPEAPWWVTLRGLDLPKTSPDDLDNYVFKDSALPRKDYTNLCFVTIDSEKTKDMDDALYIEKLPQGGFTVYVAIADPTGYIDEKDALNAEAMKRAFSIYLPGRDIPMLPRKLSEDLCSLWDGQKRPVIVGKFTVLADGALSDDISFEIADIVSHGKLAYNKVSDFLEGVETDFKPSAEVETVIKDLNDFQKLRYNYRSIKASVFRDKPDYDFVLDETGRLKEIVIEERRSANKIVEEAMIAANACAGKFLASKLNAGIFNIHSGFDPEKIKDVVSLLKEYECPITDEATLLTLDGFSAVKRWVDSTDNVYLDCRLRKYQSYAAMSPVPGHHFGLGLEYYATWTSPIRKYGDMINHRLIKASILGDASNVTIPNDDTIAAMNVSRKSNRIAERNVKDWLYVEYLRQYMDAGTVFDAEIFDISRGGMRVRIIANGAALFIPSSFICGERTRIDSDALLGKVFIDKKPVFELGQVIKIKVKELNLETRSVVGELAEGSL